MTIAISLMLFFRYQMEDEISGIKVASDNLQIDVLKGIFCFLKWLYRYLESIGLFPFPGILFVKQILCGLKTLLKLFVEMGAFVWW